jgi:hypothetical protein
MGECCGYFRMSSLPAPPANASYQPLVRSAPPPQTMASITTPSAAAPSIVGMDLTYIDGDGDDDETSGFDVRDVAMVLKVKCTGDWQKHRFNGRTPRATVRSHFPSDLNNLDVTSISHYRGREIPYHQELHCAVGDNNVKLDLANSGYRVIVGAVLPSSEKAERLNTKDVHVTGSELWDTMTTYMQANGPLTNSHRCGAFASGLYASVPG